MTIARRGLEIVGLVVFPAVAAFAITFAALDRLFGRDTEAQRQWDELVAEAQSWLSTITPEEA